jgi:hypothetical protein
MQTEVYPITGRLCKFLLYLPPPTNTPFLNDGSEAMKLSKS